MGDAQLDYELLDYGQGLKLERFGPHKLMRPEPSVQKKSKIPIQHWQEDSACRNLGAGHYEWDPPLGPWQIQYGDLKFELRLSQSKNVGIFPEQISNWQWLSQVMKPGMKVLNLFAYTGVASIVCARVGATVCHVDASKAAVRWASDNAKLNSMSNIRWVVEEARVFLKREAARGNTYDFVILDPPPFGRSQAGAFEFDKDIHELLEGCQAVSKHGLMNSYAMNLKAEDLGRLVSKYFKGKVETGELKVGELSLSCYARF